jgi:hypothetical protein
MGKADSGLFGHIRNKVGGVVFSVVHGNNIIKQYQPRIHDKKTPKQLFIRDAFKKYSSLFRSFDNQSASQADSEDWDQNSLPIIKQFSLLDQIIPNSTGKHKGINKVLSATLQAAIKNNSLKASNIKFLKDLPYNDISCNLRYNPYFDLLEWDFENLPALGDSPASIFIFASDSENNSGLNFLKEFSVGRGSHSPCCLIAEMGSGNSDEGELPFLANYCTEGVFIWIEIYGNNIGKIPDFTNDFKNGSIQSIPGQVMSFKPVFNNDKSFYINNIKASKLLAANGFDTKNITDYIKFGDLPAGFLPSSVVPSAILADDYIDFNVNLSNIQLIEPFDSSCELHCEVFSGIDYKKASLMHDSCLLTDEFPAIHLPFPEILRPVICIIQLYNPTTGIYSKPIRYYIKDLYSPSQFPALLYAYNIPANHFKNSSYSYPYFISAYTNKDCAPTPCKGATFKLFFSDKTNISIIADANYCYIWQPNNDLKTLIKLEIHWNNQSFLAWKGIYTLRNDIINDLGNWNTLFDLP